MTRAEIGELALAWRRQMRAFDALPWGTPERDQAFSELSWTVDNFWKTVDKLLNACVPPD